MAKAITKQLVTLAAVWSALCLLCNQAGAVGIQWAAWDLGAPVLTASTFGSGTGLASPHVLEARAGATFQFLSPSSYGSENATVSIQLSSFFDIVATEAGELGKEVPAFLFGHLRGVLTAIGLDAFGISGNYAASVEAMVNATFATWSNPSGGHAISGDVLLIDAVTQDVDDKFAVPGLVTVGARYPFFMQLTVSASKSGLYSPLSIFMEDLPLEDPTRKEFFADVSVCVKPNNAQAQGISPLATVCFDRLPVPEPHSLTLVLLGLGALACRFHTFKRKPAHKKNNGGSP